MIGTRVGHFQIEEKLAAGGMGEVYLALDLKLDRRVALKFIHPDLAADPDARRRFEREARAIAALDHPYVGAVHGVEEADGRLLIVLAYIKGRSLESVLTDGPLLPARVLAFLPRIAEGLDAAHRRGIVHRDIKSANIMVGEHDLPKLVDFGIALRGEDTRLTDTGAQAGTPGFTAPEVYRGEPATTRSDVFSLGVVFYQVITGHLPFQGKSPAATMYAALNEDAAPFPNDIAPELRALEPVVRRCLEKDPARRFADAGAVCDGLELVGGESLRQVSRASPRRLGARAWAILGTVLALGAAVGWFAMRRGTVMQPAVTDATAKRTVAVLEFENLTGDASLDWMKRGVSELVSAALIQSATLDVFDAQRLGDLASNDHPVAPSTASNAFLARHGVRHALAGSILRSGGTLRLQGRLLDTRDGRVIRSCVAEGPADSGLFSLVGRLMPDLQVALEVNLTGNREAEGWLREITTSSADAYRLYLTGHQALLARHWKEAAAAYEKALDLDSTFVAARTELSGAYWNLSDTPKLQLTRAAMQRLRATASHRDQLRIDLLESVVGGDPPTLIRAASELRQLYPENRFYTYLLGRGYYTSKQYQRCLDALRPLVEQRYTWAWTYALYGHAAANLGDSTAAQRALDLGFEVTKADPELSCDYAYFLRMRGNQARAREVLEQALQSTALAESPVAEGELRLELAINLAARGDRLRARQELQRSLALLPPDDEAQVEADSLRRVLGMK